MTDFFVWVESHPHTTTLITTFISVVLAIFGWFFVAWRNRILEIDKVRLPLRVDMLRDAINFTELFKKTYVGQIPNAALEKKVTEQSQEINKKIQLLGTSEEIRLWQNFCGSLRGNKTDNKEVEVALISLIELILGDLRKELNLKKTGD